MKRNMISLAIGAVCVATPIVEAMADSVKLYGRLQGEYTVVDTDNSSSIQGVGDNVNGGQWGLLGFKAVEKLSAKTDAIAVLEFVINPDDNIGASKNRQGFVGLKNKDFGSLAIGRFHSPYKTTGGVKIDPFNASALQARGAGGMAGAVGLMGTFGYISNTIYYKSPQLGNMNLTFAIIPEERNSSSDTGDATNDYATAINYKAGPLKLWMASAINNRAVSSGSTVNESAIKVGGQYTMGGHKVALQIAKLSNAVVSPTNGTPFAEGSGNGSTTGSSGGTNYSAILDTSGNPAKGKIWFLGYQYKMGNNTLVAQMGKTDTSSATGNDTDYFAVGLLHNFSKRTRLHFGYAESDTNKLTTVSNSREVFSVGLRRTF